MPARGGSTPATLEHFRRLQRLESALALAVEALCGALFVAIVAIVSYAVAMRYFFRRPPAWSEELALVLVIWMSMLGAALALRAGEHVAVELLVNRLPKGAARFVRTLDALLITALGGAFAYYGARLGRMTMGQVLAGTGLPAGLLYWSVAVGGGLMVLYGLRQAVAAWQGRGETPTFAQVGVTGGGTVQHGHGVRNP